MSMRLSDIPVDPDADQARNWILDELSDARYDAAKPNWFDQASAAFWDWLTSLSIAGDGPATTVLLTIVIAIVVIALIVAFLVYGMPALNRRSTVTGALFGSDDERSAAELRRAAESAAADGQWALAIEEAFRAMARGLAERTILATSPGTTARGFAVAASIAFPHLESQLSAAADAFDSVRYLGGTGSEPVYRALAELERELRNARAPTPAVPGSAS